VTRATISRQWVDRKYASSGCLERVCQSSGHVQFYIIAWWLSEMAQMRGHRCHSNQSWWIMGKYNIQAMYSSSCPTFYSWGMWCVGSKPAQPAWVWLSIVVSQRPVSWPMYTLHLTYNAILNKNHHSWISNDRVYLPKRIVTLIDYLLTYYDIY
jgi:hypothetical protein